MARRTAALKPQLNQIRTWAREGRTDAWIAYQLGTTALTVQEFRSEHGLDRGGGAPVEEPVTPELVVQTISFDSPPPVAPPAAADEPSEPAPHSHTPPAAKPDRAGDEAAPKVEAASRGRAGARDRGARCRRRGRPGASATPSPSTRRAWRRWAARLPATTRPRAAGSRRAGPLARAADPARPPTRARWWRARSSCSTPRSRGAPHGARTGQMRAAFDVVIDDEQIVLRRRSES